LGCLRILGRGNISDDIVEILGIGDTTVNDMFKTFLRNYSDKYFDTYVYVPDGAEMDQVVEDYTKMGFPGCVGSMDVTHNVLVVEDLVFPNDLTTNHEDEVVEPVIVQVQLSQDIEETQMGSIQQVEEVYNPVAEQQQWVIKEALKKHLSFAYSNGQIQWPRRFTNLQKQKMPLLMVSCCH